MDKDDEDREKTQREKRETRVGERGTAMSFEIISYCCHYSLIGSRDSLAYHQAQSNLSLGAESLRRAWRREEMRLFGFNTFLAISSTSADMLRLL